VPDFEKGKFEENSAGTPPLCVRDWGTRPAFKSRRLARRIVRFFATPRAPSRSQIAPACPADRSVFRYTPRAYPPACPAIVRFQATVNSPEPNDPSGSPRDYG
jgi:hypothetical protein